MNISPESVPVNTSSHPKFGLALGGGGSRALAHIGILHVLEREGFHLHAIAGSSMGALLGGVYAAQPDAAALHHSVTTFFETTKHFRRYRKPIRGNGIPSGAGFFGRALRRMGTASLYALLTARTSVLRRNPLHAAVDALMPDINIEQTVIPFACNAIDLTHGEHVIFNNGSLREAVKAGSQVGVVFPPHKKDGRLFIDAAPIAATPVAAVRELGAEVILAVDMRSGLNRQDDFVTGMDVVSRLEATTSRILNSREVAMAEIVLTPEHLNDLAWRDFSDIERIIRIGEDAAQQALPSIRAALQAAKERP